MAFSLKKSGRYLEFCFELNDASLLSIEATMLVLLHFVCAPCFFLPMWSNRSNWWPSSRMITVSKQYGQIWWLSINLGFLFTATWYVIFRSYIWLCYPRNGIIDKLGLSSRHITVHITVGGGIEMMTQMNRRGRGRENNKTKRKRGSVSKQKVNI